MTTTKTFARKCSITNQGINEGYVVGDGDMYFSDVEHLINWLKSKGGMEGLSDEFILAEAYEMNEYYYTEWDEDDHQYIMQNGILTEIQ